MKEWTTESAQRSLQIPLVTCIRATARGQNLERFQQGESMNNIAKSTLKRGSLALVAFLATAGLLAPNALAKKNAATESATVIAHLPVQGSAVNNMFLQDDGSKHYLYLQQGQQEGFTVVDVSKPQKPNVVRHEAWKGTTEPGGRLQMVGGGIALAETPESAQNASTRHVVTPAPNSPKKPTQSVRILDLSDPKNPRTLQTFQGVTSILADDTRKLIYITNGEGLWVLRHKRTEQVD